MGWLPKKLVVVPLHFNDENFEPIDVALGMVEDPSHVHVLHVLPVLSSMEPGSVWGQVTDESRSEKTRKAILKRLEANPNHGKVQVTVRVGNPAPEIARHAKESGADLVVIAAHAHSRAHNILFGSTVDGVIHSTHCPVLVLKK
jgi:nucleotide-binding universal stress UspA family protein